MIDQTVAKLLGDLALQGFDLRILELDDFATFNINQMIMVRFRYFLVPGTPVPEIMPAEDVVLFKQSYGSVDSSNADLGVDLSGSLMNEFHIGVIARFPQYARNRAALTGNLQPLLIA